MSSPTHFPSTARAPHGASIAAPDDQIVLLHEVAVQRRIPDAVDRAVEASLDASDLDEALAASTPARDPEPGPAVGGEAASDTPTQFPWDRGPNFVPRLILGRLASVLAADPSINEALCHVVPRMAVARRLTILVAREKLGKSTWAAFCCACLSSGRAVLDGDKFPGSRVVWFGLEEPISDAVKRFEAMGADMSRIAIIDRLRGESAAEAIAAEMDAYGPALVVIDSLAVLSRLYGLAEKSEEGWTDLLTVLRHAAQRNGSAVIILHHARKSDGEYRGSTAIAAAADQIVTMQPDERDRTVRRMFAQGRWRIADYSIRYVEDTMCYELLEASGQAGDQDAEPTRRLLEYLRANPGVGKTAACDQVGIQALRARALFDKLCEQGFVVRVADGRGYAVAG